MKIINLKAENVKKLVAVDITPDENMVIISGKNGAGKSSLLDSIYYALAGKGVIPQKPIREGAESATITLDLGKVVVERRFTEKGTTVKVSTEDGAKYQKPQELLDTLLGSICFDPLEFSRMKPRDQYDQIKDIIGIGDQLEELEADRKKKYDERTDINRSHKEGLNYIESLKAEIPEGTPDEEINIQSTIAKARNMEEQIADYTNKFREHESILNTIEHEKIRIQELKDELKKHEENHLNTIKSSGALFTELGKLKDTVPSQEDIAALHKKVSEASETNKAVSKKVTLAGYQKKADDYEAKSKELTADIDKLDADKAKLITDAKLPIDGLDLRDGQVFYNDIPFDQLCSAEKLKISTSLAMSADPKLKIVRIQDGSLLDDEGLKALEKMALEKDFQVWIEIVQSSDNMAIIIEDGEVKKCEKNPEQERLLV